MTTRYSGRIEGLTPSPGSARGETAYRDLIVKSPSELSKQPTPADTLARLLDTHHWLRMRKEN